MEITDYIAYLDNYLDHYYKPGAIDAGHDWRHVKDVERMGPRIQTYLDFDLNEFKVAAKLHNTDRSEAIKNRYISHRGWEWCLRYLLLTSPFGRNAIDRIVFSVLHHSDYHLPEDSPALAVALQDADKLVRFRPSSLVYTGAHNQFNNTPAFLLENPFGFDSTHTTHQNNNVSAWSDFMCHLEWIGMLSCDAARDLIDPSYLAQFILFLKLFGKEIAEHTGVTNTSENDIRKALGSYYNWTIQRISMHFIESELSVCLSPK